MRSKLHLSPSGSWPLKALSLFGSLLSMPVIVVLLFVYNNKSTFKWHGVTLNALVALFSTIARSLFVFAVSKGLGQWKWLWFLRARKPLMDFEIIDGASRGPLGGIQLLWRTKGGYARIS